MTRTPVSVALMAFNEEGNIGHCLDSLVRQQTERVAIAEVVVVSSGSTDRTNDVVRGFACRSSLVRLIAETKREGKASAINSFLREASSDLLVLESADTVPALNAVEELCLPFEDSRVGMTGARPIPSNGTDTFAGFFVNLVWALHHEVSLELPKTGEMIAFRRIIPFLPRDVSADEDWIRVQIERAGYRIIYVPSGICYNRGPDSLSEIARARIRSIAGELALERRYAWRSPTMHTSRILRLLLRHVRSNPRSWAWVLGSVAFEACIRLRASHQLKTRGEDYMWAPALSSKRTVASAMPPSLTDGELGALISGQAKE